MRKLFFMFFIAVSAIMCCFTLNINQNKAYADSVFAIVDSSLVGFVNDDAIAENVVIPRLIDGVAITSIDVKTGDHISFSSTGDTIKSLDLSQLDRLQIINASVFKNCTSLAGEIYLPSTVTSVGRYAFLNTKVESIIVNNESNTLTSIADSSFPVETVKKVVFPSKSAFDRYMETTWSMFEGVSTYKYEIKIEIDGEVKNSGIYQIKGDSFEEIYPLIEQYLNEYDIISIKQDDAELSLSTIASGNPIVVKTLKTNEPVILPDIVKTYGQEIIVNAEVVSGATYEWVINSEEYSNNSNSLNMSSFDAGEYNVECVAKVDGEVVNKTSVTVVVNKAIYEFSFPTRSKFEYFEFEDKLILPDSKKQDLTLSYEKLNNDVYESVSAISLGNFKAIVKLNDNLNKNYYLNNDSFLFEVVRSQITISWGVSEYNYTGEPIKPSMMIVGNTWGQEVVLIPTTDSITETDEIGEYNITIERISDEYFEFADGTEISFDWKIIETVLTIRWEVNEYNYTSNNITPVAYGVCGDITIPLYISEISTGNTNFVNADVYQIQAELPSGYNGFVLSGDLTNTLTINQTKLEARFTSLDEYIYNGQYVEILAEITTPTLDEVNLIMSGHRFKDAGEYMAIIEGVDNNNYYIEQITFEWEIKARPVEVTWFGLNVLYNGEVQVPSARVNANGETLMLKVISDYNKFANEDDPEGYRVEAQLPDGNKNYILSNTIAYYRIRRAISFINVSSSYKTAYTGENLLPDYDFIGDEGALKIKINGVETTNGVKEVGSYEVTFSSVKSKNYEAFDGEVICYFTILPVELSKEVGDGEIKFSLTNSYGLEFKQLDIKELENFDTTKLETLENVDGYKFVTAVMIGTYNYGFDSYTKIGFELNKKYESDKIKVFKITEKGFEEVYFSMVSGHPTFKAEVGEYVIMAVKQNWFLTIAGITTMSLSALTIIVAIIVIYLIKKPKTQSQEKLISKLLEKKIQEKVSNGETINEEIIKKLRKDIEDNLKK